MTEGNSDIGINGEMEVLSSDDKPLKAIREHCLDHCAYTDCVMECMEQNCPLYPYRMGEDKPKQDKQPRVQTTYIIHNGRISTIRVHG